MRRRITVLYEDQLASPPTSYGPHRLLLACVADLAGGDAWALGSRILGIPKKGDAKLRAALRDDGSQLANTGPVLAMFDEDGVRKCYGLSRDACKRSVLEAICGEAGGAPRIVLLQRNMEDVVNACCVALNLPKPTSKPTPWERDKILHGAADAGAAVRSAVLQGVPSFERLVRCVYDTFVVLDILER